MDPLRVADALAWFTEFLGELKTARRGAVYLATSSPAKGWCETGPVPADAAQDVLGSLAASAVHTADAGHNVFACPYVHDLGHRRKGRALARRHAHADIDGPLDLGRAHAVGAMVVASGSLVDGDEGKPRGHVYVRLSESVAPHVHAALCAALGRFVGGESWDASKCADNDVLRPAGTLNWKTGQPRPVAWLVRPDDPAVRTWAPAELARLLDLPWPIPAPEPPRPERSSQAAPKAAGGASPAHRLDGLVRRVVTADRGQGNDALNWAAGKAAALVLEHSDLDADEIRERLVAAFVGRPTAESAAARRREAEQTVASGWRWGQAEPGAALAGAACGADRGQGQTPPAEPAGLVEIIDEGTGEVTLAPVVAQAAPVDVDLENLFSATPTLEAIHQAAHSRLMPAPMMLACVLARVLAEVPASTMLPPVVGGRASLNLGVALVGRSGDGKSATIEVSRELMGLPAKHLMMERQVGSGEGMVQSFLETRKEKGKPVENVLSDFPHRLFIVDEIGTMDALNRRSGSTLSSTLRSALTGGALGSENAVRERIRRIRLGTYRLVLLAGVQPALSDVLLNDADAGTPQRFLWVRATDPTLPASAEEDVDWPDGLRGWRLPEQLPEFIDYPDQVKAEIRDFHREKARGNVRDELQGHLYLIRLKVAAALALLHYDEAITEQWWQLAGVLVDHSLQVQGWCRRELQAVATREQMAKGRGDAERALGARERADEATWDAAVAIWRTVERHAHAGAGDVAHAPDEGCTARCVTRAVKNKTEWRAAKAEALELAMNEGWLVAEEVAGAAANRASTRYRPGDTRPREGGGRG
ncbi:hypothetical protein ACTQ49_11720 [Luteococcus sp. Sow4_B9]|uniref:hypothetical protein n=1 Tax=Luteococcus sp. Sow4_B9 TaxID=3438792 RepID=UPI003F9BDF35